MQSRDGQGVREGNATTQVQGQGSFLVIPGDIEQVLVLDGGYECAHDGSSWRVVGRCMEPDLIPGDELSLCPLEGVAKVGWIIVYRHLGCVRVHRVVRSSARGFWARGDGGVDAPDGPIEPGQVVGRVVGRTRGGTYQSFDRAWSRWSGIAKNRVRAALGEIARRTPRSRRLVEIGLLRNSKIRSAFSRIARSLIGPVRIVEVDDSIATVGAAIGSRVLAEPSSFAYMQGAIRAGLLVLVRAESRRYGELGQLLLYGFTAGDGLSGALIFDHRVRPVFRSMGLGRELLGGAEVSSRRRSWRFLARVVDRDNVRAIGTGESQYWKVMDDSELGRFPPDVLGPLLRGNRILLYKEL